jgi:predicted glycosyltransferase
MSIGTVGRLIGCPSFVFNEDDAGVVPLFAKAAYPTCSYIVTPECLGHENYGSKHLTYPGYHELAYLHPEHFTPDPSTVRSMGLEVDEPYFILRFVALKAHHDTRARGLSVNVVRRLLDILRPHGTVLITSEGSLPDEFSQYQFPLSPRQFHDVLAFAAMCISDSQTVTAEAAVLGVPNIRTNTFVGRIRYLEDLEKNHGLTKGFLPYEADKLITEVQGYLSDLKNVKSEMQRRRTKMLAGCLNVANWQWEMILEKISF